MPRHPERIEQPSILDDPFERFDYFRQAVYEFSERRRRAKAPITKSYAQMLTENGRLRILANSDQNLLKRLILLDDLRVSTDDLALCFSIAGEIKSRQENQEREEILAALSRKTPILHGRPYTTLTKPQRLETLRIILHKRKKGKRNKQIAEQYGIPLQAVDSYASSLLQLNLIYPLPHLSGRTPQTQIVYDHVKDELTRNPRATYQEVADAISKKLGKPITIGQVRDAIYHQRQEDKDSIEKKKEPEEVRLAKIREALQELQGKNPHQPVTTSDLANRIGLSKERTRELRRKLQVQSDDTI